MLEQHKEDVFVCPNIGFTVVAAYEASEWFTEEQVVEFGIRKALAGAIQGVKEFRKRGVWIRGRSDYGFRFTPHEKNARDLDHLVQYSGFTPIKAIQTMTKPGGQGMAMPNELGQVHAGFLADLLLVEGNPVTDPKVLLEHDRLGCVMKDGRFHGKS